MEFNDQTLPVRRPSFNDARLNHFMFSLVLFAWCCAAPAQENHPPEFEEVYSRSLGQTWCEQNRLTVVDVDGDGRKDIVAMVTGMLSQYGPPWHYYARALLFRAVPGGGFTNSVVSDFPGDYGYNIQSGDVNNDGKPDIVLRSWLVTHILLNDGHGNLRRAGTAPTGFYLGPLVDLNRDGHLDLVSGTQRETGGLIESFLNDGTGTNFTKNWQSRLYEGRLHSVDTVLPVDLNGDDKVDLAARGIYGGRLITFLGSDSTNVFVESDLFETGASIYSLATGRVNKDSRDDLAYYDGLVRVFTAGTNGLLNKVWESPPLDHAAFNLALADFDRDGFDDIFVGTFNDGRLRIFHNDGGTRFSPWWESSIPGDGYSGAVADVNSDGWPDLILSEQNRRTEVSHLRVWINRSGRLRIEPTNEGMVLRWPATLGKRYQVQFTSRWTEEWTSAGSDMVAVSATAAYTDPRTNSTFQRFYRVLELP